MGKEDTSVLANGPLKSRRLCGDWETTWSQLEGGPLTHREETRWRKLHQLIFSFATDPAKLCLACEWAAYWYAVEKAEEYLQKNIPSELQAELKNGRKNIKLAKKNYTALKITLGEIESDDGCHRDVLAAVEEHISFLEARLPDWLPTFDKTALGAPGSQASHRLVLTLFEAWRLYSGRLVKGEQWETFFRYALWAADWRSARQPAKDDKWGAIASLDVGKQVKAAQKVVQVKALPAYPTLIGYMLGPART